MARDRKRAKQRRGSRRGGAAAGRDTRTGAARAASLTGPPNPVEHASGEVEEFDAAIARGAASGGAGPPAAFGGGAGEFEAALAEGGVEQEQADDATAGGNGELADAQELGEEQLEDGDGNGAAPAEVAERTGLEAPARRRRAERAEPRPERHSLVARAVAFLRASWAELQRMQWPDRRQTSQATAVVLGFVVVAGVYLGVADWVAQKIVNFIL